MEQVILTEEDVTITNEVKDLSLAIAKTWKWWHDKIARYYLCSDNTPMDEGSLVGEFKDIYKLANGRPDIAKIFAIKYGDDVMGIIFWVNGFLSIVTDRDGWKQGKATIATKIMVRHIFDTTTVERISALIYCRNKVARNFFQRVGFKIEGKLRNMVQFNGPQDAYLMGIISEDVEEWGREDLITEEVDTAGNLYEDTPQDTVIMGIKKEDI